VVADVRTVFVSYLVVIIAGLALLLLIALRHA
jgi:hypothetical protein